MVMMMMMMMTTMTMMMRMIITMLMMMTTMTITLQTTTTTMHHQDHSSTVDAPSRLYFYVTRTILLPVAIRCYLYTYVPHWGKSSVYIIMPLRHGFDIRLGRHEMWHVMCRHARERLTLICNSPIRAMFRLVKFTDLCQCADCSYKYSSEKSFVLMLFYLSCRVSRFQNGASFINYNFWHKFSNAPSFTCIVCTRRLHRGYRRLHPLRHVDWTLSVAS